MQVHKAVVKVGGEGGGGAGGGGKDKRAPPPSSVLQVHPYPSLHPNGYAVIVLGDHTYTMA